MRFFIIFLATLFLLLAITSLDVRSRLLAQDDATWKDRFLTEARPAWNRYRARAKRLQGSIERTTIRLAPKREVLSRDRCEIKQRNGCALFLAQELGSGKPPDTKGIAMCINNRYGFDARRRTPASPWVAVNLDVDLSDGMHFRLGSSPNEGVVYWSTCATTFFFIPSFALGLIKDGDIKDPALTLQRVTSITQTDRQAVKIEFDYRSPTDQPRIPSFKGWIVYDPQRFWAIREYNTQVEYNAQNSSKIKASAMVTYEYEETEDGFPIPKHVVRKYKAVGGVDSESHHDFDLKEADVPESDFTLSAFGLPEPPLPERPFPWYLVVSGVGTACLGGFFFLRARARRLRVCG